MKLKLLLYVVAFTACITTSCKRHVKKHIGTHTDIYIAGTIRKYYSQKDKDSISTAVYWKNGVLVQLSDSLNDFVVRGIAVHNHDVYVVGYIPRKVSSFYSTSSAAYWKNGVLTQLGEGAISGIAFKGNDVYMVGTAFGRSPDKAVYWENGKAYTLGKGRINSIYIDGDDIYMAGSRYYCLEPPVIPTEQCSYAATYWKNDKVVALHDTLSGNSSAESIFVQDGDVHVAGYGNPDGTDPLYWKNGRAYSMKPKSAHLSFASSIAVDDYGRPILCGGMYVGHYNYEAVYWSKNRMVSLPHKGKNSGTGQMALLGSDIYIAGHDQGKPVYWKNGQLISLSSVNGNASAIAIVNY